MTTTASRMLTVAAQQFAEKGFSGASMRSIATASGTTQAAIYHHFPNKDALYLAVLARHFEEKTSDLVQELAQIDDPDQCLRAMVRRMLELADEDDQFRQLYFRELLEGDAKRLEALATNVFGELSGTVSGLLEALAPDLDSHLVLLSLTGLVCHHLEARKLTPYLPGGREEHQRLDVLADHITQLLFRGAQG